MLLDPRLKDILFNNEFRKVPEKLLQLEKFELITGTNSFSHVQHVETSLDGSG